MNSKRILPILAVLLLAMAAPALATVTVTVSSSAHGANVTSPVNIVASATTNAGRAQVTGWYIYVDSVAAWNTSRPTIPMNVSVTMTAGTHTFLVRPCDTTGPLGAPIP